VVLGETPVTGFLRLFPHESKTDAPPSFYWTGIAESLKAFVDEHAVTVLAVLRVG
jgi:hypothetical protein